MLSITYARPKLPGAQKDCSLPRKVFRIGRKPGESAAHARVAALARVVAVARVAALVRVEEEIHVPLAAALLRAAVLISSTTAAD